MLIIYFIIKSYFKSAR